MKCFPLNIFSIRFWNAIWCNSLTFAVLSSWINLFSLHTEKNFYCFKIQIIWVMIQFIYPCLCLPFCLFYVPMPSFFIQCLPIYQAHVISQNNNVNNNNAKKARNEKIFPLEASGDSKRRNNQKPSLFSYFVFL